MLHSIVIFPSEACGVLKEYKRDYSINEPHIIYVPTLTTDVAFYVIHKPVCGIISEESSFATHGANILRCYFNAIGKEITWVSGVKRFDIYNMLERVICIKQNGEIRLFDSYEHPVQNTNKNIKSKKADYLPMKKRSIVKYNLSNNTYKICYWPHRSFDRLTFSIMKIGLVKNLALFQVFDSSITLDELGNIWFCNAPFIATLTNMAVNTNTALPFLDKQISLYEKIQNDLIKNYSFSKLTSLIIDYFSVFLLFHDTYEDVLVEAYRFFESIFSQSLVYEVMNTLMTCKLDEWMFNNDIILEKKKSLLSNEKVSPIPPFTIKNDIVYCINRFSNLMETLKTESLWNTHREKFLFYINFFVTKEWKFVINKLLFTRFSDYIKKSLPNESFESIAKKSIFEIQKTVKEDYNAKP